MKAIVSGLFLVFCLSLSGQSPGFLIERSPDGRYLRLYNKATTSSAHGTARDLTIYDFNTNEHKTFKQVSAYGGFSPGHAFQAYSMHAKERNKHVYKNELINQSSGASSNFADGHLVLKPLDDGKILATKPGFDKYGNVKSQAGLYILDPKSGKKVVSLLGKKADLKVYTRYNHRFTDDFKYSVRLKSSLEILSLENGDNRSVAVAWPDVGFLGTRLLLEADGQGAVVRATITKDGKKQWFDYYLNFNDGQMHSVSDHTRSTLEPDYELIDGKLYTIFPAERTVKKYAVEGEQPVQEASWTFNAVDYRRDIKEYRFALASEDRLAVIHFVDGLMQLIDLGNDSPIKEVGLFRKLAPTTTVTAQAKLPAQPQKKVYNNTFLNSFDQLPIPYVLDYNTIRGRSTQRPNGQYVSAIGLLGNTTDGSLIVLMMRRYNAQGAEVIRFQVAVYDEQANLKSEKEVGFTSKDQSGVPNKVDFVINRKGQDIAFEVNQKEGNANRKYQVIINKAGAITRTN